MPHVYPQETALRDGRRLLLRPFTPDDVDALHDFFQRLPENVLRFAWDRLEDRAVVEQWGRSLDYSKTFPLLACDDDRIVGDATLHFREYGPLRLVGRIRWLIDPDYRNQGLQRTFVRHFIDVAKKEGLRRLNCMLSSKFEKDGIDKLVQLGFTPYVIPGYGTDPDGGQHDMTLLVLDVTKA